MLRVLNWIAAPFGSKEHQLMRYGAKDVNWEPDDKGNPATAPQGCPDTTIPWQYMTQPPNVLYFPTAPEYPHVMQDADKRCCPSRRSPRHRRLLAYLCEQGAGLESAGLQHHW